MKCPHCLENFHHEDVTETTELGSDQEYDFEIQQAQCPACKRMVITLLKTRLIHVVGGTIGGGGRTDQPVHPRTPSRVALGSEIPVDYASDYREAAVVLADSAKASAALSRRLLQRLLREVVRVKPDDLSKEIDQVLESAQLQGDLARSIDAIRNVGNFAAHPTKDKNTGEIVDVEPGEAEWLLDVIEDLFDALFTRPVIQQKRVAELEQKLKDAGKPPLKTPPG